MADEVDRLADGLQLALKPIAVGDVRRGEVVWQRRAESRRRKPHHILAPERVDQRSPDRVSLWIAMHQNDSHGALLVSPQLDSARR